MPEPVHYQARAAVPYCQRAPM